MLLSLAVAVLAHGPGCAHGPRREAWDQWTKPEATEQERARDFADCRTHGQSGWIGGGPVGIAVAASMTEGHNNDVYRACMIARGCGTSGPSRCPLRRRNDTPRRAPGAGQRRLCDGPPCVSKAWHLSRGVSITFSPVSRRSEPGRLGVRASRGLDCLLPVPGPCGFAHCE